MPQLTETAKQELEKQQYRVIGNHSAVKVCGWTKKMIKGEGGCYKLKFYGIMSNQCMQMTTSISCANRCTFCWRGYKAPVSEDWKWEVDEPEMILQESLHAHRKLLNGFGGNKDAHTGAYEASKTVKHVALSLTGEPIAYPKMNALLKRFNEEGISTFLVTNAQYPEQIRDLEPVTQLYISLDAPTKELLKQVDVPLFKDYWERLQQSLEFMAQKKQRTCIRMTLVKEENMCEPAAYAKLIMKGDPDFIEVKGYMFVGASRQRLSKSNMPFHEEVVRFSQELEKCLPDYALVSEHIPSRVVMFAKKKFFQEGKWHTWIDFPKYHTLVLSGKTFSTDDYLRVTPQTGISGQGTFDHIENIQRRNALKKEKGFFVDEKTDELEFWKE
ncbi:4-demethylwyosine synthase TYW1 [Candidatus Woesearchaeota archaeon]|nr:4-demethylwyosine synthase TYW1 [Candidatus Woesearchaeota archaeon]